MERKWRVSGGEIGTKWRENREEMQRKCVGNGE
jgi:hypothetical protein